MKGQPVTPSASLAWTPVKAIEACSQIDVQEQAGSTSAYKVIVGPDVTKTASAITVAAGQKFSFGSVLGSERFTKDQIVGWLQFQTGSPTFTQVEFV